jgi:anthranilate phosphoribosyltransferase
MNVLAQTLNAFKAGQDLDGDTAEPFFSAMIAEKDEDLLAEILSVWNDKGIKGDEIFFLASIMRDRMRRIRANHEIFIDAVGTGGSRAKTFNVSTAAAFVIAAAGIPVAKHGNRAASSKTGSADVLSELGVRVDVEPETAERSLNEIGICFMFAPKFHSLSPTLAGARHRLGKPTIFNCLGPLCNPADAPHQVIGVWDRKLAKVIADVLARIGTKKSWVVHGEDGLDEITLSGRTFIYEVCCENVRSFEVTPSDFGITVADSNSIPRTSDAAESAAVIRKILGNEIGGSPAEQLVLINAAAGIYISGAATSFSEAYDLATRSVRSGNAFEKFRSLGEATNR